MQFSVGVHRWTCPPKLVSICASCVHHPQREKRLSCFQNRCPVTFRSWRADRPWRVARPWLFGSLLFPLPHWSVSQSGGHGLAQINRPLSAQRVGRTPLLGHRARPGGRGAADDEAPSGSADRSKGRAWCRREHHTWVRTRSGSSGGTREEERGIKSEMLPGPWLRRKKGKTRQALDVSTNTFCIRFSQTRWKRYLNVCPQQTPVFHFWEKHFTFKMLRANYIEYHYLFLEIIPV